LDRNCDSDRNNSQRLQLRQHSRRRAHVGLRRAPRQHFRSAAVTFSDDFNDTAAALAMTAIPLTVSGPLTIALIVLLGIYVYPRWLAQRATWRVALATPLLIALFVTFELAGGGGSAIGVVLAVVYALAPLVAGIIVARLTGKSS
jgi:hypothetical protein